MIASQESFSQSVSSSSLFHDSVMFSDLKPELPVNPDDAKFLAAQRLKASKISKTKSKRLRYDDVPTKPFDDLFGTSEPVPTVRQLPVAAASDEPLVDPLDAFSDLRVARTIQVKNKGIFTEKKISVRIPKSVLEKAALTKDGVRSQNEVLSISQKLLEAGWSRKEKQADKKFDQRVVQKEKREKDRRKQHEEHLFLTHAYDYHTAVVESAPTHSTILPGTQVVVVGRKEEKREAQLIREAAARHKKFKREQKRSRRKERLDRDSDDTVSINSDVSAMSVSTYEPPPTPLDRSPAPKNFNRVTIGPDMHAHLKKILPKPFYDGMKDWCPHQALQVKKIVYGIQEHPNSYETSMAEVMIDHSTFRNISKPEAREFIVATEFRQPSELNAANSMLALSRPHVKHPSFGRRRTIFTEAGSAEGKFEFGDLPQDYQAAGLSMFEGTPLKPWFALWSHFRNVDNTLLESVDDITTLSFFLIRIYHATTSFEIYSLCWMYLSTGTDNEHVSFETKIVCTPLVWGVVRAIKFAACKMRPTIKTEALSDTLHEMSDFSGFVFDSTAATALKKFVLSVTATRIFPKDVAGHIYSTFGKATAGSHIDLMRDILSSMAVLVKTGELLIKGVSFKDSLWHECPLVDNFAAARDLLVYKDKLYTGLPAEGRMDIKAFVTKGRTLSDYFKLVIAKTNPASRQYVDLQNIYFQLLSAVTTTESLMRSNGRRAPIGIMLAGPPHIGKSEILPYLAKVYASVKGREFDESHIYVRCKSSDYWEGYVPESQPYVHYSELGSMHRDIAAKSGDPMVDELCSLIDTAAFPCNTAFDDKGKVFAAPDVVFIDTNIPDLNLDKIVNNPSAVERRFYKIFPTVKPEYRKDNTAAIDFTKCNDGARHLDRWTFTMYRSVPQGLKHCSKEFLLKDGSIDKLTRVLMDLYAKHIDSQEALNKRKVEDRFAGLYLQEDEDDMKVIIAEAGGSSFAGISQCLPPSSVEDEKEVKQEVIERTYFGFCRDMYKSCVMVSSMSVNYSTAACSFAFYKVMLAAAINTPHNPDLWIISGFRIFLSLLTVFFLFITGLSLDRILFIQPIFFLNYVAIAAYSATVGVSKRIEFHRSRMNEIKSDLTFFFKGDGVLPIHLPGQSLKATRYVALAASAVALAGICKMAYDRFKDEEVKTHTEATSNFHVDDPKNSSINEKEELVSCGVSYKRFSNAALSAWNTVHPTKLAVHHDECLTLYAKIVNNTYPCTVAVYTNGVRTKFGDTHVVGICENYALINTHALGIIKFDSVATLCVHVTRDVSRSTPRSTRLSLDDFVNVGDDVAVIRCSAMQFTDIRSHIPDDAIFPKFAKGVMLNKEVSAIYRKESLTLYDEVTGDVKLSSYFKYALEDHRAGMCGTPLVINKDSGNMFVGIHAAGDSKSSDAFAAPILLSAINKGIEKLRTTNEHFMPIMSQSSNLPFVTEAPLPKSPFRFEEFSGVQYFGKIPGPVMINSKSQLRHTFLAKSGDLGPIFLDTLGFIPSIIFEKPVMKPFTNSSGEYISPYNIGLRTISSHKKPLDRKILNRIIKEFSDHIIAGMVASGVKSLEPLTMEAAINGVDDDPFTRSVTSSTAGGFGWPGKKSKYIPVVAELPGKIIREPVSNLKEKIDDMIENYVEKGETNSVVFTAQLKDEPRERSKVAAGKTRLFYASPLCALIVNRMFLCPFYTHLVEMGEHFGSAVGIDMHREAHTLWSDLTDFSPLLMEGDYRGYDMKMPFDIGWAAYSVIHKVLKYFKYNSHALRAVIGVLTDNLFPYIVINLDLLLACGLQCSGKYATAEDNCLRGILLLMYAWYVCDKTKHMKFFDCVNPKTYGDDLLAAVKKLVAEYFNNVTYSKAVTDLYDMTYTNAAKGESDVDFVPLEQASFLKRTFRHHEVLNRVVAPLDLNSVYRSLQWYMPSKHENVQTQMLQTMNSAVREIYFHVGQDRFDAFRSSLVDAFAKEYELSAIDVDRELITFNALTESLCSTSEARLPEELAGTEGRQLLADENLNSFLLEEFSYAVSQLNNYEESVFTLHRVIAEVDRHKRCPKFLDQIHALKSEVESETKQISEFFDHHECPLAGHSPRDLKRSEQYHADPVFKAACDEYIIEYHRREELEITLKMLNRIIARRSQYKTQSSTVSEMKEGLISNDVMGDMENMIDVAGAVPEDVNVGVEESTSKFLTTPLDLQGFFERPVQIDVFTMPINTAVFNTVDIWNAYLSDPVVRSKLRNYAYIRGNMHFRVAISGTPFHYGRLMVSYYPFPSQIDMLTEYMSGDYGIMFPQYLSQAPGCKIMDVRDNAPADFTIPFVSPQPVIRLFNNSATALSGDFDDATNMGWIIFKSLNTLQSVAATPTDVSVYVYAWMTDVELGCPTGSLLTIVTESSNRDERRIGPVENIATRALDVANALSTIPEIGIFARASAIALRGVAGVAALFGWSYPVIVSNPMRIKNEPYQNGAQLIGCDTGKNITLDPLQELTVDPRFCGVKQDELSLAFINQVESYLDTFSWAPTVAPLSGPLWNSMVHPRIAVPFVSTTNFNIQPTAMAFACLPFRYWRGSIIFRVEIVCSAFHRGKLMIYYEPNLQQQVLIDANLDTNKQFARVIDIQETQSVEFCVDWAFPKPWANQASEAIIRNSVGARFAHTGAEWGSVNGYIGVTPFTKLQSPDDSTIQINVYVRSEDMQYNRYTSEFFPVSRSIITESSNRSVVPITCIDLNPSEMGKGQLTEEYFGEQPVSFRSLLKRFQTIRAEHRSYAAFSHGNKVIRLQNYPMYDFCDPYPGSTFVGKGATPWLLYYLRYAYLAMRGSMRFRWNFQMYQTDTSVVGSNANDYIMVTLDPATSAPVNNSYRIDNPNVYYSGYSQDGTVAYLTGTNAGVEFQLPFYSNNLFAWSCTTDPYDASTSTIEPIFSKTYTVAASFNEAVGTGDIFYSYACATGEDFTLARWLGAPPYLSV